MRANVVPGVAWRLDNPTPAQFFNIAAFQLPAQFTFGNVGRNTPQASREMRDVPAEDAGCCGHAPARCRETLFGGALS